MNKPWDDDPLVVERRLHEAAKGHGKCSCDYAPCQHDIAHWKLYAPYMIERLPPVEILHPPEVLAEFAQPALAILVDETRSPFSKYKSFAITYRIPMINSFFVVGNYPIVYRLLSAKEFAFRASSHVVTLYVTTVPETAWEIKSKFNCLPPKPTKPPAIIDYQEVPSAWASSADDYVRYLNQKIISSASLPTPHDLSTAYRTGMSRFDFLVCTTCLSVFPVPGPFKEPFDVDGCRQCDARFRATTPTLNTFVGAV